MHISAPTMNHTLFSLGSTKRSNAITRINPPKNENVAINRMICSQIDQFTDSAPCS